MKKILILFSLAVVFLTGCSTDMHYEDNGRKNWNAYYETQYNENSLNQNSRNFLADYILTEDYDNNNIDVIEKALDIAKKDPTMHALLNLADISFHMGLKNYDDEDLRIKCFLYSAIFSYGYLSNNLFDVEDSEYHATLHYRQSQAIDIYNLSTTEIASYIKDNNLWNKDFTLTAFGGQEVKFSKLDFNAKFDKNAVEEILLSPNYKPINFNHISRIRGLGVPATAKLKNLATNSQKLRYATNQHLPVTYSIGFEYTADKRYIAKQIIWDSFANTNIEVGENEVALEQDFTNPLALMLKTPLKYNFVYYMLFPGKTTDVQGLYMLEPLDEKKIPVIFVHGLLSNTRTWMQMINTLMNDPELRDHYQFWGYTYSSGNPIIYSAKNFHNNLNELKSNLKKSGYDMTNFNKMILVGHSMGGLLCKTTAINDSETTLHDTLLENQFNKTVYEKLPKKEKEAIDSMIDFHSLDYVKRIIFIATPHRGANMATGWIGFFGSALIELPQSIIVQGLSLGTALKENGYLLPKTVGIKTGIQNLSPDDRFLGALNRIGFTTKKKYHSIIGDNKKANSHDGTDGIVAYSSSHIDEAESELVVKSSHSAQKNPLAIQELRRILLLAIEEDKN